MRIIKLALRNLARRPVRTSLTVLGVTVAIAFTVGLLSISEGFIVTANQSIARQGEHILVQPEEMAYHPTPMIETYGATFPEELVDQIHSLENVKAVYPIFTHTMITGRGLMSFVALNGVTPQFLSELRPYLILEQGRFLQKEDEYAVVVGAAVAREQGLSPGSRFNVRGKELEVVGVLRPSGAIFEDMLAYAPLETLQLLLEAPGKLTLAAVTVTDVGRASETAREISGSVPGVSAQTSEEVLGTITDFIGIARAMHFSVASIALLIGILFVLSTMMMAVSERVREIGTMRAIGASQGLIFRLILVESLVIGLVAGALGCLGGYLLSKLISFGVSKAVGVAFLNAMVTPRILAMGMVTALLIGALAGLYPAWRISRANIVESLRHE